MTPDAIVSRIEKALALDGTHSWADVQERLHSGRAQMFWNENGAWITEVLDTPLKRYLNVWVVAGELPEVMDLQPEVIKYARDMGCSEVAATARRGWKHVARAHGWKEKAMLISHEVPNA